MPPRTPARAPATAVLLALGLSLGLAGCGGDEPAATRPAALTAPPRASATGTPAASATPSATASSAAPAAAPTGAPTSEPTPERSGQPPASAPAAPPAARPTPQDPLSPRPAVESAAPLGQPQCRPADLTVVDADTLVLEQVVHEVFAVRTTGPDCQLEGYPGVRLADAAGARLPVTVTPGAQGLTAPPAPVTLSRATSVSFVLATPRDGTCVDAASADVTLPGTSTPIRTATALPVCAGSVGVSPVQRRTDEE